MKKNSLFMIIFFIGVLIAITAAAKMPQANQNFSDNILIFVVGIIISIVANIFWHKEVKSEAIEKIKKHRDSEDNPVFLLQRSVEQIQKLNDDFDRLDNKQVCQCINDISENFIHPFTEKRYSIIDIMGMEKGSEVLLTVAYGERMLNRVWSACSDGHRFEAKNSLDKSNSNYLKAIALVEY